MKLKYIVLLLLLAAAGYLGYEKIAPLFDKPAIEEPAEK